MLPRTLNGSLKCSGLILLIIQTHGLLIRNLWSKNLQIENDFPTLTYYGHNKTFCPEGPFLITSKTNWRNIGNRRCYRWITFHIQAHTYYIYI